ncbi:glutathione S-transferase T3-like [Brassica napus]|uniref:glutathione S-transferase T3-like n=1 Tax=Brassica napus TaxID=3708 RepID=UPI002078A869|nr:glutathione S-transferase T3-like [Brassica napus]
MQHQQSIHYRAHSSISQLARDKFMDPYSENCSFQNLLNSQQPKTQHPYVHPVGDTFSASDASVFGSQWTEDGNDSAETEAVSEVKGRRKWSPTEDGVLISAWLNTSKDPIVGNEQKAISFWKRIAAYCGESPKLDGLPKREQTQCKQRWGKINEGVCKFVGSYHAATKQRSSGQSEDDVLKMAHEIFYNDYKSSIHVGKDEARPVGVKASKANGKRSASKQANVEEEVNDRVEFHSLWEIRQKDFALQDKLKDKKLLDSLIAKTEPLNELEIALKNKLIKEMFAL